MFYSNKVDHPDEWENWQDRGCELHPSCLSCPEPVCVLELPGGKATRKANARLRQCLSLAAQGVSSQAIACQLGVSVRTIQRTLKSN